MAGHKVVASAAIFSPHWDRALVARRSSPGDRRGNQPSRIHKRWEWAGGKTERGELPRDAVVRECLEELGVRIRVVAALGQWELGLPASVARDAEWSIGSGHATILQVVYVAHVVEGEPRPQRGVHSAIEWLTPDQILSELPDGRPWCPDQVPAIRAGAEYGLRMQQLCAEAAARNVLMPFSSPVATVDSLPAQFNTSTAYPSLPSAKAS